jgi:hypothetical protein
LVSRNWEWILVLFGYFSYSIVSMVDNYRLMPKVLQQLQSLAPFAKGNIGGSVNYPMLQPVVSILVFVRNFVHQRVKYNSLTS